MDKIFLRPALLLSLLLAVGGGAAETALPKALDPEAAYTLLLKEDIIKEIKRRWEFVALNTDTYQYELAQLDAKIRSSASSSKDARHAALNKKVECLAALLNAICREVEDSLNNLSLDEALLLFGKTSALLKGVDEVRYAVMIDELFSGSK